MAPIDEAKGWDGRFNGQDSQIGVYVWTANILFIDGQEEIYSGDIMVLRKRL